MTSASPAWTAADIASVACHRFATHLDLLAHQFGETGLAPDERDRLAAALETVRSVVAKVAAMADLPESGN
ncbi:MAG TPA: hypothetical protein VFV66_21695 [Nonomuraea sp.]|nr:hypothetical protein [Nonomuraea sp.]